MNRFNELKLEVLSLFAATGEWLGPNEAAERLNFYPARAAWTYFKRRGRLACWRGVLGDEELWNTVSVIWEGRGFVG